jgi:hypothetical protein
LRLKNCCEYFSGLAPGVDVVVAIFCHFWPFYGEKRALFSKTSVMIKILHNLDLFWAKNANFLQKFSAKEYFSDHNIGPCFLFVGHWTPPGWCLDVSIHIYIIRVRYCIFEQIYRLPT